MQPEILICSRTDLGLPRRVAEAGRDRLRDRDRARVASAQFEAGRNDVGDQPDVGGGEDPRHELLPEREQVVLLHVRQHEVLFMGDAQFAVRKRSVRSAKARIWSDVMSPGEPPTGFRRR